MASVQERRAFNPPDIHRGLTNQIGENNCFLNVTIQALWHLGPFRVELQKFIDRIEKGKSNNQKLTPGSLLESICHLFLQYEFSDQKVLPPNELRESLCQLSGRYEFGKIADANETLDTILHRIHTEQSATCPQMKKCLSHKVFGGLVMEQTICQKCRAHSEPMLRDDFISCFQAMELINEAKEVIRIRSMLIPLVEPTVQEAKEVKDSKDRRSKSTLKSLFGKKTSEPATVSPVASPVYKAEHADPPITDMEPTDFGILLHKCMEVSQRSCPANDDTDRPKDTLCQGKGKVCFFSLEPPLALALSVGWTQAHEDAKTLRDFYSIISDTIQLCDLFSDQGGQAANRPSYTFRGLVCYYGLHYVSIFQEMGQERYLLFDDQKVRVIGDWNAVKDECVKSKYQPVLLLYELNKSSACMTNTESDDELELVMSEKAKNSTRAQKVRIENDTKPGQEEVEVESKTGDAFILTSSPASANSTSNSALAVPTVAAVVEAPSMVTNLIDLTSSSRSESKPGPFTSPDRAAKQGENKPQTKTSPHPTPQYIVAAPVTGDAVNARTNTGVKRHSGTGQTIGSSSSHPAAAAAVVGSTNTTFGSDMFAPQEDTHMSSLIAAPVIASPIRAEPKHGSTPSSHSGNSFHTASSGQSGSHHSQQQLRQPEPTHLTHTSSSGSKHTPHASSHIFSEMTSSASQSLLQGLHLSSPQNGHMLITKWAHRPLRYNVVLSQELIGNGKKTVGMTVSSGPDGKPLVGGFFRHPVTHAPLPAERSGLIQPGDRVVTINDIELREYDLDLLTDVLRSCDSATFTMASKSQKNLWYACPRCTIQNVVDQDTEARLKSFNNNRLLNEVKSNSNEPKGYLIRCVMCRSENMADSSIHDSYDKVFG